MLPLFSAILYLQNKAEAEEKIKAKAETKGEAEGHPEPQSLSCFFSLVFFLASAFPSAFVLF